MDGGAPIPVPGTDRNQPMGLEVVTEGGSDVIYYTGVDPVDGEPAVFRIPAAGGEPVTLVKGPPLMAPDRLAVAGDGTVYLTDGGTDRGSGTVFRLADGRIEAMVTNVTFGGPAGIALTADDSTLLVSSLDPDRSSSQVLLIDPKTGETGVVDKVIGANSRAGDLHRAHSAEVFAWADLQRHVYRF